MAKSHVYLDLSVSTVRTNNELSARVAELEEELAVWKQARSQLIGEYEREKQRLENEVNVLQRRISDFEVSQVFLFFFIN